MSLNTLMNEMPKTLRDELRKEWLLDCFYTDEKRRTIKPEYTSSVTSGIKSMIRSRRERMAFFLVTMDFSKKVELLSEIEVLNYFYEQMTEAK